MNYEQDAHDYKNTRIYKLFRDMDEKSHRHFRVMRVICVKSCQNFSMIHTYYCIEDSGDECVPYAVLLYNPEKYQWFNAPDFNKRFKILEVVECVDHSDLKD